MACLGVQIGSSGLRRVSISGGTLEDIHCQLRHSLIEFRSERRRRSPGVCSVRLGKSGNYSASVDNTLRLALAEVKSANSKKKPAITPQLDQLMKQSVAEIVKNINEAPFLVHVYTKAWDGDADRHSLNSSMRMEIERAKSDRWPFIRQRWEGGNSAAPDGVILVEELCSEEGLMDTDKVEIASSSAPYCTSNQHLPPFPTKVWGLLVQGRGASCHACYILKTCQVKCCSGFTTHFCLAKVDCFGQSLDFHLNRLWLQR